MKSTDNLPFLKFDSIRSGFVSIRIRSHSR